MGLVIDDILEKGNFDSEEFANKSVVFEYADLSKNMPVLFKLLEKSHLLQGGFPKMSFLGNNQYLSEKTHLK